MIYNDAAKFCLKHFLANDYMLFLKKHFSSLLFDYALQTQPKNVYKV